MIDLWLSAALLILLYTTFWFAISVGQKRNDVADIAWGLGYVLLCGFLFFTQNKNSAALLVYSLVSIWGLRLSTHLFWRNRKKTEDFRYKKWREEWGRWFYLRSYFQVYLLQGLILLVIATPLFVASRAEAAQWSALTYVGSGLWLTGFYFQAVADFQLLQFKRKHQGEERIMKSGLWRYSRHPNYFGELLMWWGIFLIVLPLPHGWWAIISPLSITFLLLFVSGIPMLEKRYEGHPEFEVYKKRTSVLIPWIPRKE